MAKLIEYDVSDVEESTGGTGVKAKPGVYAAEIVRCTQREEKRDGTPANDIEVALNVGEDYDWLFTYIGLSKAADWKLKEFVSALNLKDKGKLDPEKMVGKIIRVKVNPGTYEGEPSPDAGRLMKAIKGDSPGPVSAVSASKNGAATAAEPEDDADDTPDDKPVWREGQPDPDDVDALVGPYDEWEESDLLAEVEDRGLILPGGRGAKKGKAITALRADDEQSGTAIESEGDHETSDGEDYTEWDTDDLIAEYEGRGFEEDIPSFRGRNSEQRKRDAIIKALSEDDGTDPFDAA